MQKVTIAYSIIASAVVWGVVLIACAGVLQDVPQKEQVIWILSIGASTHLLFIWGPLAARLNKLTKGQR